MLDQKHAEWLEDERKIPCELAAEMGITSKRDAIGFPYSQNGRQAFTKFRTPDKRWWIDPPGAGLLLWNLDSLSEASGKGETLIITEGEIDALSWLSAGAPYVVSVPNGAPAKAGEGDITPSEDRGFGYLWAGDKLHPDLAKFDRVILSTDDDPAGHVLRDELAIRIGRPRCLCVRYPQGCKDANDVLRMFGASELGNMLRNARPIVSSRLVPFSEIPVQTEQPSYGCGWEGLKPHLRIVPPELIVVTGTPNAGKSQWTLALVANLARLHGLKGAILQFEDNPERNRRDLMKYAQAWRGQAKNGIDEEPAAWIDRMFRTIAPAEDLDEATDFNLAWLQYAIEEAATRHGAKWVLIDPWNEIEHVWRINETETAYTNQALRELKRLSRRFQLAIIVVTHPSKGANGKSIEDLSLYDVSGSAAWKNKADHGIIIHRNSTDDPITYVKVDKSKDFAVMGIPGVVRMTYEPRAGSFKYIGSGLK